MCGEKKNFKVHDDASMSVPKPLMPTLMFVAEDLRKVIISRLLLALCVILSNSSVGDVYNLAVLCDSLSHIPSLSQTSKRLFRNVMCE
jgi:hypothetical protein